MKLYKKNHTVEIYTKMTYKTFWHAINTFISLKQSKINIDKKNAENAKYCLVYCIAFNYFYDLNHKTLDIADVSRTPASCQLK